MVPCGLAGRGLGEGFFFELPPGSVGLHFPPLAIFLFQPLPQFLGFSPQPLFLPAPGLLFLPLVPGQTLLHRPLPRFQGPLHDRQQLRMRLVPLMPELDKGFERSFDPLPQLRDGL